MRASCMVNAATDSQALPASPVLNFWELPVEKRDIQKDAVAQQWANPLSRQIPSSSLQWRQGRVFRLSCCAIWGWHLLNSFPKCSQWLAESSREEPLLGTAAGPRPGCCCRISTQGQQKKCFKGQWKAVPNVSSVIPIQKGSFLT